MHTPGSGFRKHLRSKSTWLWLMPLCHRLTPRPATTSCLQLPTGGPYTNIIELENMAEISPLIEGLKILQKYEPNARVHGMTRATGSIELQEEAFGELSEPDRGALLALGWQTNGHYVWKL